jgi:tRNA 2-thiouridine synthesizing protein A
VITEVSTEEDIKRMDELIRTVKQAAGARCSVTGAPLGPHAILASIALGRRDKPMSLTELARAEGQSLGAFRERMLEYLISRPCHSGAWLWASNEAGYGSTMFPALEWDGAPDVGSERASSAPDAEASSWDAGDMGCGDLVMELRTRLKELKPGQVLKVLATDAGAPEDLPAWCRMTGNPLVKQESKTYWIQRKGD